ncbi:MAG TPA: type II toxin-antitoxin system RelE/ParE family toxin [Xanthobacteraceae bacterium]|nr:type II toxin-antitoxin system RelE/ParE family toxin [Xanthobacteraceae bacterium]
MYSANTWSSDVREKHLRAVHATCGRLVDWPLSGRSREELASGLRSMVVRPHVVFYRVIGRQIEIVRVLDGRRDLDAIFADFT